MTEQEKYEEFTRIIRNLTDEGLDELIAHAEQLKAEQEVSA